MGATLPTPGLRRGIGRVGVIIVFFVIFRSSQNDGQIVPTPRGSILHHTKPSQVPYNAQNRFFRDIGHI